MAQQQFAFEGDARIQTAISLNYVPHWGAKEILREILQEALDVKKRYKCSARIMWRKGKAVIEDDGPGLKPQDLALGQSSKREESSLIGQFGEGLKLAALVAARMGRKMTIETVGFTAEPIVVWDHNLQCEVLAFDIRRVGRTKGTRVTVEASQEEFQAAKSLFLEFNEGLKEISPGIYIPGGKVFINGAFAASVPNAIFSYNLPGKAKVAQNRDRTTVDMEELKRAVQDRFREATAKVGEIYFQRWKEVTEEEPWEYSFYLDPPRDSWSRALKKIFGARVCYAASGAPEATLEAKRLGFEVFEVSYHRRWLLTQLGVPEASAVLGVKTKVSSRVPLKKLTAGERENLNFARRIARRYFGEIPLVRIAEKLPFPGASERGVATGLWDAASRKIWLRRSILQERIWTTGVLLHEVLHAKSDAPDASREFETAWENLVLAVLFKQPWQNFVERKAESE